MKSFSLQYAGRLAFLASGLITSIGSAVSAQDVEFNLRTKLESLKSGILNPFASSSGIEIDGNLPSNIRPSVGNPFAALQSRISDATSSSMANRQSRGPYYTIPGTNNRIHFSATEQHGDFSRAAIKKRVGSVTDAEERSRSETSAWDDLWYRKRLPDSGDTYYLLFWHDWTARQGEWAAIKNTPQAWYVYSSTTENLMSPRNGTQLKFHRVITKKNQSIDIDIYNPDNTGGYTSNDILFGFGW